MNYCSGRNVVGIYPVLEQHYYLPGSGESAKQYGEKKDGTQW